MSVDKSKQPKVKEQESVYDIPERFEILSGIRYDFLSSPKYTHQKISTNLHIHFHSSCQHDGEILLAPMDVHFDEANIVQPDVIYIANSNLSIIRDGFIFGVPDLLVEILSESTGRRDKTIKKQLYEQFGVKEYWVVDPIYRTVDQFVLVQHKYQLFATLVEQDYLHSQTVSCLSIDLNAIFPPEENKA